MLSGVMANGLREGEAWGRDQITSGRLIKQRGGFP
jgi:hypothetical protein